MSLPFLAADGDHDDALPHAARDTWMRTYRPGPLRVALAAMMLVFVAYLLVAAGIMGIAGNGGGAGTCLVIAAAMIVTALRILRVGFWVSGRGLRQVGLFYTVTLPWDQVGSVRTAQQPVKVLGLPRTVMGQALVVTRAGGAQLRPLLTDHNADFWHRTEAFDMAADAIEAWAAALR